MFRPKRLIAALATVASVGLVGGLAAPAGAQEPEGDASGITAVINGVDLLFQTPVNLLNLPPTPFVQQPPGGSTTLLNVPISPLLTAGVLNAASNAFSETGVASSASVLDAGVLEAFGVLTADAITAQCESDVGGSTGGADVANLASPLAGVNIPVGVAPNTVIPLPLIGTLTLNEQAQDESGIRVRSLHLVVNQFPANLITADVIISEAACFHGTAAETVAAEDGGGGGGAAAATSGTPNLTG